MYFTDIEHERERWRVDLNVVPDAGPGVLDFVFTRPSAGAEEIRHVWRVTADEPADLWDSSNGLSEERLRRELSRCLAAERTAGASGEGMQRGPGHLAGPVPAGQSTRE